jgi:transposase
VHKETVVACARIASDREVAKDIETFGTTTEALLKLSDWLTERGYTHVAMEATGIYWKPVWHVLGDGGFELILANARTSGTCRAARPTSPTPPGWRNS